MTRRTAIEKRRRDDARMVPADFNKSPFTLAWEITRACALSCMHCRAEAQPKPDPNELTHDEAIGVIDQIRDIGDPILVVTGGDPLMRRDVCDLLAYAVQKGLRTSLTPSAKVHAAFRGSPRPSARPRRVMRDVVEAGIALQINTTVSRFNLPVLEQMVDIVAESGAVQWSVFFLVPTGRGKLGDMVSAEEHERVFNWLYDLSREAPFDVKSTAAPAYRRVAIERARAERRDAGDIAARPLAGAGGRVGGGGGRA